MMATLPSLVVSAVTTFDGKALKKGSKEISSFEKGAKKAAGALAAAFSVDAIIRFGKEAAKAFIADQKAASQLAVSVKNLGLAFETPKIERFISELSQASGVADDMLRPSMQKLLQTTGSVTKSQELLTQALDISRGSGVEYESVVGDLASAYVGNTKGLKKYSLGLTNAELKTMSFSDVQSKLTAQFSGASAAYLTTYAGQIELLGTAAGEAKESIGKGLVTALQLLAGEGNTVQPLADSMQDFGTYVGDAIIGTGVLIDKLNKIPGMGGKGGKVAGYSSPFATAISVIKKGLDELSKSGAEYTAARTIPTQGYYGSMAVGIYPTAAEEAKRKKAEADALKRQKDLAALTAKGLAEAKKKAALEKSAGILDLERIGIAAALKGQISETDRLSLNLQLALLDKNDTAATKLAGQLTEAVKRQNDLNALLLATPEAPNPYRNWYPPNFGTPIPPGVTLPQYPPSVKNPYGPYPPNLVPDMPSDSVRDFGPGGGLRAGVIAGVTGQPSYTPPINITVELDGQTVGGAIRDSSINDSLSGSFNTVNRGNFRGAVAT